MYSKISARGRTSFFGRYFSTGYIWKTSQCTLSSVVMSIPLKKSKQKSLSYWRFLICFDCRYQRRLWNHVISLFNREISPLVCAICGLLFYIFLDISIKILRLSASMILTPMAWSIMYNFCGSWPTYLNF